MPMTSNETLCPICSGVAEPVQRAVISPWIRELAGVRVRQSRYLVCTECESGFFDYRYSESEMRSIYHDYREKNYLEVRHKWEPSYTKDLNSLLGGSPEVLHMRHEILVSFLNQVLATGSRRIETVLDIGGDRGQFMPPRFPNRYVLEASKKELVAGVRRVASLKEARSLQIDLVMATGILEHLPNPISFMRDLLNLRSESQRTLLYIEVPNGVPAKRSISQRFFSNLLGLVVSRSRYVWATLDSRAAREPAIKGKTTTLLPMRQSEHLNFLSVIGLRRLVENAGAKFVVDETVEIPNQFLSFGRLQFSSSIHLIAELS